MSQVLFVRALTRREARELRRLLRANRDARIVRRAQVVQLSARGKPPSEGVLVVLTFVGLALILMLMIWVIGLDMELISRQ